MKTFNAVSLTAALPRQEVHAEVHCWIEASENQSCITHEAATRWSFPLLFCFFIWNPTWGRWKSDERGSGVHVMAVAVMQRRTLPTDFPRVQTLPGHSRLSRRSEPWWDSGRQRTLAGNTEPQNRSDTCGMLKAKHSCFPSLKHHVPQCVSYWSANSSLKLKLKPFLFYL